jgi:hypothetical protein
LDGILQPNGNEGRDVGSTIGSNRGDPRQLRPLERETGLLPLSRDRARIAEACIERRVGISHRYSRRDWIDFRRATDRSLTSDVLLLIVALVRDGARVLERMLGLLRRVSFLFLLHAAVAVLANVLPPLGRAADRG